MEANEYQRLTRATAVYPAEMGLTYTVMGLAGEGGEVAGKFSKVLRGDKTTADIADDLIKELGDVLWFVARVADELGTPLSEVMELNIAKLKKRQEEGKLRGDGDNR